MSIKYKGFLPLEEESHRERESTKWVLDSRRSGIWSCTRLPRVERQKKAMLHVVWTWCRLTDIQHYEKSEVRLRRCPCARLVKIKKQREIKIIWYFRDQCRTWSEQREHDKRGKKFRRENLSWLFEFLVALTIQLSVRHFFFVNCLNVKQFYLSHR